MPLINQANRFPDIETVHSSGYMHTAAVSMRLSNAEIPTIHCFAMHLRTFSKGIISKHFKYFGEPFLFNEKLTANC